MGKVKKEVAPAQKIQTIKHKAWQVPGFQIPKTLSFMIIDIFQEMLKIGFLNHFMVPTQIVGTWFRKASLENTG